MTITQQASALAAKQAAQTIAYPDAHKDNATYIRYLTIKDIEGPRDDVASVLVVLTP